MSGLAAIRRWASSKILIIGELMTFTCLLAPLIPFFDFFNHFRLYTLAGCIGGLFLFWPDGTRFRARFATLVALNAVLLVLALKSTAETRSDEKRLNLVALNVLPENDQPDTVTDFLAESGADIIVLTELNPHFADVVFPRLKTTYPHQLNCPTNSGCLSGLLSKKPWVAARFQPMTLDQPDEISADFGTFTIVGAHPTIPNWPNMQARHIESLITRYRDHDKPLIMAGDMNLTPWSWKLNKLSWQTGLLRHGSWAPSWPVRNFTPAIPFMLIDNVLTSRDIKSVSFSIGPDVGSDHLPVIATLSLP